MRPAGHAAVLGCAVPAAGRPAAGPAVVRFGSAAWPVAVAPVCFGSAAWPAVVAAVCFGFVVGASVVVSVRSGSAAWPVAVAPVRSGSAAWPVAVAPVCSGSVVGHAPALAWLPLVRAVRTQEQWFRETEKGLLFRELQMVSLVLPQLQE